MLVGKVKQAVDIRFGGKDCPRRGQSRPALPKILRCTAKWRGRAGGEF